MMKEYLILKISDLKYQIRMEEIKYARAIEAEEESIAAYYFKKVNMLKNLVTDFVKQLNSV